MRTEQPVNIKPGGFTEAGICTADLEGWAEFLCGAGGYREIWRGPGADSQKRIWGIDAAVGVNECLLGAPGAASGFVRLFHFDGIAQEEIRRDACITDSGGIFDLDIRVPDVHACTTPLRDRGWKDFGGPVDWPFGALQVREWLATGPDSVIFALIQRLAPPLEGFDELASFSHVFNSSQIVADMERAVGFYRQLGFEIMVRHDGPLEGRGGEVLGLSPEDAPATPVELVILQPDGELNGSVELVAVRGSGGCDLAPLAVPWNLGLNLLRFPVRGVGDYLLQLSDRGLVAPGARLRSTRIEPFGDTRMFTLQAPDGAWLEFYEAY